ncbi:hypothetical protein Tco_0536426 [Tanacetum coccineum]
MLEGRSIGDLQRYRLRIADYTRRTAAVIQTIDLKAVIQGHVTTLTGTGTALQGHGGYRTQVQQDTSGVPGIARSVPDGGASNRKHIRCGAVEIATGRKWKEKEPNGRTLAGLILQGLVKRSHTGDLNPYALNATITTTVRVLQNAINATNLAILPVTVGVRKCQQANKHEWHCGQAKNTTCIECGVKDTSKRE